MEALLLQFEIRMLVLGNMYKNEAIPLAKLTEEIIPASPLPGVGPVDLSLLLPEGVSQPSVAALPITRNNYQAPIIFTLPWYPISMSPTLP
jgi:insulysin